MWGRAVSDLWVYDYTTGEVEMWLPDLVSGAAWSPAPDPKTGEEYLAVAVLNPYYCGCSNLCYDLQILSAQNRIVRTIRRASPYFSWSPDGQWLTFFGDLCGDEEGEGVYIASVMEEEPIKIAASWCCGSIYDRPIWAQEHGAVFYPKGGIHVALVDGSDSFPLVTADFQPVFVEAQYTMLWSPQRQMLILAGEGGMETPSQVVAYELSDDLRTVVDSYVVGDNITLAGWLVPDEAVILTRYSQIVIWPLEDRASLSP
jgi:dipeptidyl aminopeptidase/acylaminoacyl peptidase